MATVTLAVYCCLTSCSRQMPVLAVDPIPNNSVLRGVGLVSGSASEPSGIRSVLLYVDGKRNSTAATGSLATSKWQAKIDTTTLPMGLHYLTVMATAKDGRFTQQTVTMVVAR